MNGSGRGIKAGVIGTGSLGKNHARLYASSEAVSELYLYDMIEKRAGEVAALHQAKVSRSHAELLDLCDVVSICTPATDHFATVKSAFEKGVHVLVEKPIASDSKQGREMVDLASEKGLVFQVGHIERFNGTYKAVKELITKPLFIESHRLGTFVPRGIDVSVVVDLMIHDIDLVLDLLRGDALIDLKASGAAILTGSPDIVNARLEFESGCVANLTASRISREPLRKVRFFQENRYVSADFRAKEIEAFSKSDDVTMEALADDPRAFIKKLDVEVDKSEPLMLEIESFLGAVAGGHPPEVTGEEALDALIIAERILDCIKKDR
ncbi:MAG: Gfo/Idh/MocA family oxidoreductase [Candidatus Krumholzibacteriota bacterium]|nr:Gfo/Idh/MocA family oxidoreductase [Candidatus Krumholzibacteriota bacterium]